MTSRKPGKLRPLASAVRIVPLTAAALTGSIASGATVTVTDPAGNFSLDSCTIFEAIASLGGSLVAGCTLNGSDPFGVNDTVDLSGFADPTTITLQGPIDLTLDLTIRGNLDGHGQPLVTLARDSNSPPFRLIHTTNALTIDGVALTGGNAAADRGGAIYTNALTSLTLVNAVVTGNAAVAGGAITILRTNNINIGNSVVSGNYAHDYGGGILCLATCGTINIADSIISDNQAASGAGGGIYTRHNVIATGSIVSGNSAYSSGGGILAAAVVLNDSTVSSNFARGNGGGVNATFVTATHTVLHNNYSNGSGGAIFAYLGGAVTVSYGTIDGNRAAQRGGGIASAGAATIFNSTITGNTAHDNGGGIASVDLVANNSTFDGNSTNAYGGGIYSTHASLVSTTISANHFVGLGSRRGVGLFVSNAVAFISGTLIFGNTGGSDLGGTLGPIGGDHDLVGTKDPSIALPSGTLRCDPRLEPLAVNGGATQTRALPPDSCAVDQGPVAAEPNDQRGSGFARIIGTSSDIGAFEVQFIDKIFKDGFED